MKNEAKKWDKAAGDYQRVFSLGLNEYSENLLRFWFEEGMLPVGARIIDIGCGVGKYGSYLAELGYDVTLTDISAEMLRHASDNMAKYATTWAVYQADFSEITGKEPAFSGGFDLSISTMSPAIHDVETVRKMASITHGWCFLARFRDWKQPLRDELMQKLGLEPLQPFYDLKGDVASMIQAVSNIGYVPFVKIVDYNWADRRTPEEMADYMLRNYFAEEKESESLHSKALLIAKEMSDEKGYVLDSVNTKVAWIYWKT